jgi:hypothetical protein
MTLILTLTRIITQNVTPTQTHMHNHNPKVRSFTLLAPSDESARKVIEDAGFQTISMTWQQTLRRPIGIEYQGCGTLLPQATNIINILPVNYSRRNLFSMLTHWGRASTGDDRSLRFLSGPTLVSPIYSRS